MFWHGITWKTKVKYIVFSIYSKDDDIRWTILLNKVCSKSFPVSSCWASQMNQITETLTFWL